MPNLSFELPHSHGNLGVPRHLWSADQLQEHLANLQRLQTTLIDEQVQHLNELSTLTRMANALAHRRNFDEVIDDLLCEIGEALDCCSVWFIESKPSDPIGPVHQGGDPVVGPSELSRPVVRLCRHFFEHPDSGWQRVVAPSAGLPDGCYIGLPVVTAKHLIGSLVIHCADARIAENASTLQLIQGITRQTAVACENDRLVQAVGEMMVEVVYGFSLAIESRDPYTGGHSQRVTAYALLLAQTLGVDSNRRSVVRMGGLLHDIGKVAIPDVILRKPGRLSDEEFDAIKQHPLVGVQILENIPQLAVVHDLVRSHHERWDGRGYPDGLAGEDIPYLARILAVADSYDAMTSDRPYRSGMSHEKAIARLREASGTQFEPVLTEAFTALREKDLHGAAKQMEAWSKSKDRCGSFALAELLQLDMRRVHMEGLAQSRRDTPPRPLAKRSASSHETVHGFRLTG